MRIFNASYGVVQTLTARFGILRDHFLEQLRIYDTVTRYFGGFQAIAGDLYPLPEQVYTAVNSDGLSQDLIGSTRQLVMYKGIFAPFV